MLEKEVLSAASFHFETCDVWIATVVICIFEKETSEVQRQKQYAEIHDGDVKSRKKANL